MKRPSVTVKCVADRYHLPTERIVEFSFPSGQGGLISFRVMPSGTDIVEIYRIDNGVHVFMPTGKEAATA